MKNQIEPHDLLGISDSNPSAKTIVARVLEERENGRPITDAQVLAAYPQSVEALRHELKVLDKIRQAMLAAKRTGFDAFTLPPLSRLDSDDLLGDSTRLCDDNADHSGMVPTLPGYLLAGETSRGGQAVVYQAVQESTGRRVAIKVMSGGPFASSNHRIRFEREAKILASLDHPNIVSILERARTPDGSFYLVMPFVEGVALDEYWISQVPRTIDGCRDLVRLFMKILQAIHLAHSRGVVHRDLKPSNIRVDRRGEPHILDFGLARPADELCDFSTRTITMPGQIIGSLPWASPEQAAGHSMELDARSDIYAIGVMLYQAVTGRFPYSLEGPIDEVLLRIRKQNAEPPTRFPDVRPGVDDSLGWIVLKSLEKERNQRYQTAAEFSDDFKAWLDGQPTLAGPRRARFQRSVYAVLITAIVCAGLSSFGQKKISKPEVPVFELPTISNSLGITFVKVPAGRFTMGSPLSEAGHKWDEYQNNVAIDHSYYIATTETTQRQFETIMGKNPSDRRWWGPNLPAGNVSLGAANEFCRRLGEIDHAHYRLPTEIEWEYACRAGSAQPFPIPENPNLSINSLENTGGRLQPVGCKQPNSWGLFDMQGNVGEWCSDSYFPEGTPGSNLQNRKIKVVRGGSAMCGISECRAASRIGASEVSTRPDWGFRVVRDP